MGTSVVVELEVLVGPPATLGGRVVRIEVDLLIFAAPPEPFREGVVHAPSPAVRADPRAHLLDQGDVGPTGEVAPLVAVENPRSVAFIESSP